jgi:biopolymer transport protein ExbB
MTAFWKFVTEEWYFAVPMLGLSFVAFTLVFWRLLLNLDTFTRLSDFLPEVQSRLSRDGVAATLRFCRERSDIIPRRLFVAGLSVATQGPAAMRRAMNDAIERDILPELRFLLPPILAIGKIATMVGLLGTVISMVQTFTAISTNEDNPGVAGQAGAIGLALFATAMGLVIAIPLVFTHVLFRDWVHRFERKMKYAAEKLIDMIEASGGRQPPGEDAATASAPSPGG